MTDVAPPARLRRASSLSLRDGLGSLATKLQGRAPPAPELRAHGRKRRPMVVSYSSAASADVHFADQFADQSADESADDGAADGPPPTARPSRRSSALRRMSLRLSSTPGGPGAGSAAAKARKYDVDWRDDRAAACCQLCFSMFTTLSRRRHHCRVCGELVCGDCSPDQVALAGRFAGPKRACNACVTLLEVLAAADDPRVRVHGRVHKYGAASAISADASATTTSSSATTTNSSSTSPLLGAPTPRYRDRRAEVRRVMAAGDKARRRGGVMCVLPARWVRQWLAFTEQTAADDEDQGASKDPVMAPGAIDNWQLLEFAQGRLVQRAGTVRDDPSDDPLGFQLVAADVFDVLQRLYGGGPTIRVDMTRSSEWQVDLAPVLTALPAHGVRLPPVVERALLQRHAGHELAPIGDQPILTPRESPTASTSSATTSVSDDDTAAMEPVLAVAVAAVHMEHPTSPDEQIDQQPPRTPTTAKSPSAATATAASAFALAMKQARLNAQRAIDERARVA